jgi:type VI secretion system protein
MREHRLLQRIRTREKTPHERSVEDPKRVIDSVLDHIQRILNTRQGSVPIGKDYGVPDFTELSMAYPGGVRDFESRIRQTIEKYEPRLKAVRVRFVHPEDGIPELRFKITGRLVTGEKKAPVIFQSVVGSDRKIRIRR